MHQVVWQRAQQTAGHGKVVPSACLLSVLTFLGCAVGPRFQVPTSPKVSQYGPKPLPTELGSNQEAGGGLQHLKPGLPVAEQWWAAFGNERLNRRIEAALAHNPSVEGARASLRQAQAYLRASQGAWYPAVDAGASATRLKQSVVSGGGTSPFTLYNASVNVSYTLDLFGSARRGVEVQEARVAYQRWQLEGATLSLAANVATATFQEAAVQAQLEVLQQVLGLLREQADLTAKQVAIGAKSQGDLLAVQAQVASAEAALPPLQLALASLRNQLAVLMGRLPSDAEAPMTDLSSFRLPEDVPLSLPSELVRRRPDILAAEAQLHAATAQVGLATADLFPHIRLGGAYGSSAFEAGNLFKEPTTTWSLGLNLLQPIFHGGSLRAMKRAAEAGLDGASAAYRGTVLHAFRDVSDALNALQFDADTLSAQARAEQTAAQSLDLVKGKYRIGSAGYLQLLDATRQWQLARLGAVRARAARLADTAALYAALGGGWQAHTSPSDQPPSPSSR